MSDTIIVAIITCAFSGSGLLVALLNSYANYKKSLSIDYKNVLDKLQADYDRLNKLENRMTESEKSIQKIIKGVMIGLENDRVIFNAFRTNHINGESEKQEQEINKFFSECTQNSFGG